jgi:hypothetical protein
MGMDDPNKPKALVVLSYWYLTVPIYQALKKLYPQYNWILLDPRELMGLTANLSYRRVEKPIDNTIVYDNIFFRLFTHGRFVPSIWNKILFYSFIHLYTRGLLAMVYEINPDLIVLTSDWFQSARIISDHFNNSRCYLIQPCFLDLWHRPSSTRRKLVNKLISLWSKYLGYKTTIFGLVNTYCRLLIWDSSLSEFYNAVDRDHTIILNPVYASLRVERQALAERQESFHRRILIMPAIYKENFGVEYQSQLEKEYKDLARTLVQQNRDFLIKIHPNESLDYWKKLLNLPQTKFLESSIAPHQAIMTSSYVISTNSYSAVESTILGVPCYNLNPSIDLIAKVDINLFSKYAVRNIDSAQLLLKEIFAMNSADYWRLLKEVDLLSDTMLGKYPPVSFD